jgi:two-component system, sensor histidine kinase LadS
LRDSFEKLSHAISVKRLKWHGSIFVALKRSGLNLYNLLSNAIKYSPGKENIDLSIGCDREEVTINLENGGIGIPEEDIPKIFTVFDRASNIGNISGTGLGLPIVKKALEMHGSRISLSSELNKGSKFTIIFHWQSWS